VAEPLSPLARALGEKANNYLGLLHFACAIITFQQRGLFG
jgi:hypothetical protein